MLFSIGAALAEEGFFKSVWLTVVEAFPMGNVFAELIVRFAVAGLGAKIDVSAYLSGVKPLEVIELLQDFGKLCLTAVIYECVSEAGDAFMGIRKEARGWAFAQKALWHMFSALLCALLCNMLLAFAYNQINCFLPTKPKLAEFWTNVISFITLAGSTGVFYFIRGTGVLKAILSMVKMAVFNVAGISMTYAMLLILILCAAEGNMGVFCTALSIWMVLQLLLVAFNLMLEPLLGD